LWAALGSWNRAQRGSAWPARRFALAHLPLAALRWARLVSSETFGRIWMRHMAGLLRGLRCADLDRLARHAWSTTYEPGMRPATLGALRRHQASADLTVLVTSSYAPLLTPLQERLGFDYVVATKIEIVGGAATGSVAGRVVTGDEKVRRVRRLFAEHDLAVDLAACPAYADTERDLDLLQLVGHPVATYPSRGLERLVRRRGWPVLRDA